MRGKTDRVKPLFRGEARQDYQRHNRVKSSKNASVLSPHPHPPLPLSSARIPPELIVNSLDRRDAPVPLSRERRGTSQESGDSRRNLYNAGLVPSNYFFNVIPIRGESGPRDRSPLIRPAASPRSVRDRAHSTCLRPRLHDSTRNAAPSPALLLVPRDGRHRPAGERGPIHSRPRDVGTAIVIREER